MGLLGGFFGGFFYCQPCTDPYSIQVKGFEDQKKLEKIYSWKKQFFGNKNYNLPIPRLHKGYRRSLQPSNENTLQNMLFLKNFSSIFASNFCPPGSGSGFRIHWSDWIRTQSGSGSETLLNPEFTFGVIPNPEPFQNSDLFFLYPDLFLDPIRIWPDPILSKKKIMHHKFELYRTSTINILYMRHETGSITSYHLKKTLLFLRNL